MASLPLHQVVLGLSCCVTVVLLIISPVHSITCKNKTLPNNRKYTDCVVLPVLHSYLHFSYNASNSTLSVAFTAPPAEPNGWVAWGLNPTSNGMAGGQALVGLKQADGSVSAKTYNISSYYQVVPERIAFDVWDLGTHYEDGNITIFADLKLPADTEKMNHIWQVGPGVNKTNGHLKQHKFKANNLNAMATLDFVARTSTTTTNEGGVTMINGGYIDEAGRNNLSLSLWLVSLLALQWRLFLGQPLWDSRYCVSRWLISANLTGRSFPHLRPHKLPGQKTLLRLRRTPNSTISVAFIAPPPKPGGWVAWALNPTSNGMMGSQALVGLRHSDGSVSAQAYNIDSYFSVIPSRFGT
ncbi:DOMON domain containing protein [Trema orientale]|uniref:DOMON domain containing protein n=1 Tax=Trema orientale TaxID=63057 RepID=A0A2P5B2Q6_TREOI|nr:DOMON domain containing protein [Trema orientale]